MNHITYLLIPLLATACFGCGSDENGDNGNDDENGYENEPYERPEETQAIITDAQLDELVDIGATIYQGTTPPELAGVYDRAGGTVAAADNNSSVGRNACDSIWTVEATEESDVYSTSAEEYNGCSGTYESPATYLSGSDDCFTLYVENDGQREGCDFRWAQVISGCLEEDGISDYEEADLGLEHDDSSECQSLINQGTIPGEGDRIIVEYPFVERQ